MLKVNLLDALSVKRLNGGKTAVIYGSKSDNKAIETLFYNIGISECCYCGGEDADLTLSEIHTNKDSYYIWLTESINRTRQAEFLQENGFLYIENFNYIEGAHYQTKLECTTVLDPNLGHATVSGNRYGTRSLENDKGEALTVAILGASLVDETFFQWKLWPEILQEKLQHGGKKIKFLLAGCYAYTTSQSYIKLVRDVIPQKPDYVIEYSPWENDCFYGLDIKTPFVMGFQKKESTLLKGKMITPFGHRWTVLRSEEGYSKPQRSSQIIIDNIRNSKAICDANSIKYYCVFPPSVSFNKKESNEGEEMRWAFHRQDYIVRKVWDEIEEGLTDDLKDCVIDGRYWMDDKQGLFYDCFHMYEEGNRIVADKLMELLIHDEKTS